MTLPKEVKQKAYALYVSGLSIPKAAKYAGISDRWLYTVAERENWQERRKEHEQLVAENSKKNRDELEETMMDAAENVFLRALSRGEVSISLGEITALMKYRRLKAGLSTENVAVKSGELTLEERYREYLERKKRKELGQEDVFIEGVLPGVASE